MKQNLKMMLHFTFWCLKNIVTKVKNTLMGLLRVRELLMDYTKGVCDGFRQSFSFGFLGYMLSIVTTFGMCTVIDFFSTDRSGSDLLSKGVMSESFIVMITVAMGINTIFYGACLVYVMYEKFLKEYDKTWDLLKEVEHEEKK